MSDQIYEAQAFEIAKMAKHIKDIKAENAKLREERDEFKALFELKDTQFNNVLSSVEMIKAENAKLRELGGEVASILFNLDVDRCGLCKRDDISHPCPVHTAKGGECPIKSELRELGVEVE